MRGKIGTKRTGKRIVAAFAAISLTMGIIPAFSLNVFAAEEFSGGSGTASAPYIIETAADLKTLADKVNAGEENYAAAYYALQTETYTYTDKGVEYTNGVRAVSIDLSDYDTWTPIGTEEHPFKGHFNGSSDKNRGNGSYGTINHAKLQIDKGEYNGGSVQTAGIFGYIDGATIENVAASVPQIGAININAYSAGDTAYHCVGGLIGFAKDSTIRYCTTYTSINLKAVMGSAGEKKTELYVGGVIGAESGSEVFRCVNNSTVDVRCTEDNFDGNNSENGKKFPDMFAGGIAGGVIGISSAASKIHGSENMSEIVISIPRLKNADNIRLYSGGIVGSISGLQEGKLELCQDYNRSSSARARVTNSQGDPLKVSNVVACAGGIFGYDDEDKLVHVHDCKNDAGITNAILLTKDSENSKLYSGGIVAGRGNVDNCLNIAMVQSMQPALSSGICYSVPHHCYSTGMVPGAGQPICVEVPTDDKNYYNYFTNGYNGQERHHPTWQYYMTDTQLINNGGLTWLLQGDQDPNYLHWTATGGSPLLGGGYEVGTGGRPLDYWLNKGWGAYNNDMGREIVAFAPAWSYRIRKYRYVTSGEGNDGVDRSGATPVDLKADTSFASFEKSDTSQFYAVGYGYYCGRIGALPTVADTDEKTFIQWQTTPAATEGAAVNLGSAFAYSGANSTVYAVARVKFGAKDDDGVYRSVYGDGNTIDNLNNDVNYGTKPDTTAGKFTYTLSDVTTEDDVIENAEQYFRIDGEKLIVAENTPVGVYTVGISAAEKAPVYTLLSASLGFDAVNFTLTAEVVKADPAYTEPTAKQRVYDGKEDDVITAGSTADGKILYTFTPADDTSWSENVPQASELGLYTVYWKIEGDSNHNDKSPSVVSGLIYPDSSDPANAIIVTPTADWTYDQTSHPLATVTKPDFAEIEWSSDNTTWTDILPTATNAGSYPVYWRVKTNDYGIDDHGSFTVKVSKANLTITPPTGLTKKYTGEAQELVTAGSVAPAGKGVMKYSLNPEMNNWADSNWKDEIPTRTNAGDYKVYYRVFPSDLDNYNDTFDKANPTSVNAAITKLTKADLGDSLNVVPTPDWTYNATKKKLVSDSTKVPTDKGIRLMYSLDGGKWDYPVPTGDDAGAYNVKWKTVGNDNIEEITGSFTVTVSKKKPSVTFTPKEDWTYDGKTYQLLTLTDNPDNLKFSYSVNGGAPSTVMPSAKEADTYKISVTSLQNDNYETYQGSFEIKCLPASTSGTVTGNTLTFNYGTQELVTPNDDVTNGRLMYKVDGDSVYTDTVPKRTNAGTYKVWYYVKGTDANYADTTPAAVDVTIAKLVPVPIKNVSTGLVYNASAQTLLTVDTEGHKGTVKYAVKTDGTAPSDSDWTTEIPKATNAGEYKVYWKVFDDSGRDDGEKNLTEPSGVETVKIAKYPATIAYVHAEDLPYTGEAQELVEPIKARNDMGTVKYAVTAVGETPSDGDWSDEIPTGTNAGTYKVWFKIEGDSNINDVDPQGVDVTITKAVPKISVIVKSALKYNGEKQDLVVRDATVDAGAGDGTLKFAVTDTAGATPAERDWLESYPQRKDAGTYYVWYRFDGDTNTESIAPKKATSVISADVHEVAVSGKHLDYTGTAQELIEGEVDGAAIKNNTQVRYYVSENENDTFTDTDVAAWDTDFPSRTDAKKYYVWYYVPESGSNIAVGPSMVEAEIRKGGAIPYDLGSEDPDLLAPDGQSFTVPYGTKLGDITLHNSANGTYKWNDYVKDRVLTTIGTYNYPADFTDRSGNYESGTVQIAVTITKIPEPTPNIGIDYINEKLTGFDPSKTYTIWDGEHKDSTTLDIPEERMGHDDYPVVLKASTNHTTDSEAFLLDIPARPDAPAETLFTIHQPAFITAQGRIEGITAAMDYSIGESGEWISGTGAELVVPKNTDVYVRYKAVADTKFKSKTQKLSVTESDRQKETIDNNPGINYPNHTIKDLEPNSKYTISYTDDEGKVHKFRVETDEHGEAPIEEEWHKKTVNIVKNGDILYTVDSDPKPLYIDPRPEPPEPVVKDSKLTDVYNNNDRKDAYRLITETTYTDVQNPTSTNEVIPGKYVAKVKATPTSFESLDSEIVIVREKTPNAQIEYIKETLNNLDPNTEYIITEYDDDNNKIVSSVVTDENGEIPIRDSWFGTRNEDGTETDKILKISKKGAEEALNSPEQERPVRPRPEPPKPQSADSKITEVSSSMEYRLASYDGGYKTVENAGETVVVVPDDYEVRIKAVADVSFASLPAAVKVNPMATPNGTIDYKNVKIKDLEPGKDYTVIDKDGNEEKVTADSEGKIPIKEEWMETEIELIRNGDTPLEDSDPQKISIPKRPDPPKPSSKDGKITEVDDTMEYRPKDESDDKYTPVEDGKTESPVVPSGEYAVRYEATPTSFPSLPAYVTVTSPQNPTTPTASNHTSNTSSGSKATPTPAPSPSNGTGGNNQGGTDMPELNKTDHFAYISGYEDATFRPDTTIRRGEAAVIFARLIKDFDSNKSYTPSFSDLNEDMYFYNHVGFLSGYGIITGYEDGTFRPWEPITRTEFAVIASKFAELTETEGNVFSDVADDFWGKPYILLAHKNGWVNGYEDGTFRPAQTITRAEVVSIVNRMLERSCDTDFTAAHADDITVFTDMATAHWAYNDVLEAANGHLYVTEDGREAWTDLK